MKKPKTYYLISADSEDSIPQNEEAKFFVYSSEKKANKAAKDLAKEELVGKTSTVTVYKLVPINVTVAAHSTTITINKILE